MDPYNLAICFGPTLLPIPPDRDQVAYQTPVNEIIKTIILYQDYIFPNDGGSVYEKCILELRRSAGIECHVENVLCQCVCVCVCVCYVSLCCVLCVMSGCAISMWHVFGCVMSVMCSVSVSSLSCQVVPYQCGMSVGVSCQSVLCQCVLFVMSGCAISVWHVSLGVSCQSVLCQCFLGVILVCVMCVSCQSVSYQSCFCVCVSCHCAMLVRFVCVYYIFVCDCV